MNRPEPPTVAVTLDGVPVGRTSAPACEEEVGSVLAAASRAGEKVVLRGGGTRLELGAPVRADRVLDIGGLSGVIEHHVQDLTVEAWAGTTVGALNRALAPHRQFLPLDPPLPERATLGGVIAAGDPGFRVVPGSRPRDLLLGLSAVLAAGTRIRSGGRVVKNVTGYELTKLFTGSLGTLGAITRVTVRLRAFPEASRTVVARLPISDSVERFADRVLAAAAAAPGPAAVAVVPPGTGLPGLPEEGGFRLAIRFEGLREEAAASPDGVVKAAGGTGRILEGSDEAALWAGVRDFAAVVPHRQTALGPFAPRSPGGLAAHRVETRRLRSARRLPRPATRHRVSPDDRLRRGPRSSRQGIGSLRDCRNRPGWLEAGPSRLLPAAARAGRSARAPHQGGLRSRRGSGSRPDALLRGRRCASPAVARAVLSAARSAAGEGCGEGFPLPARNDGGNR